MELGKIKCKRFADGEIYVQILVSSGSGTSLARIIWQAFTLIFLTTLPYSTVAIVLVGSSCSRSSRLSRPPQSDFAPVHNIINHC